VFILSVIVRMDKEKRSFVRCKRTQSVPDNIHTTADEMWAVGVAVTLTAIWRRNVDRVHPDGRRTKTLAEAIAAAGVSTHEAYARYRRGLWPLTPHRPRFICHHFKNLNMLTGQLDKDVTTLDICIGCKTYARIFLKNATRLFQVKTASVNMAFIHVYLRDPLCAERG